jgi:hypothetical protein
MATMMLMSLQSTMSKAKIKLYYNLTNINLIYILAIVSNSMFINKCLMGKLNCIKVINITIN